MDRVAHTHTQTNMHEIKWRNEKRKEKIKELGVNPGVSLSFYISYIGYFFV